MTFKLPEEWLIKQQEEYEKQYVLYNGNEIHVTEFEDRSISSEQFSGFRMNSYARDKIYSKLDNKALVEQAKYHESQCSQGRHPVITYNDALIYLITPELVKRIEDLEKVSRVELKDIEESISSGLSHAKQLLPARSHSKYREGYEDALNNLLSNLNRKYK